MRSSENVFHRVARGIPRGPTAVSLSMPEHRTPQQVRRALARAERGAALDVGEATALLAATGADLDRLTRSRRQGPRRGPGRRRAGRGRDLLAQGLHPGHQALPRPVPLLHVRRVARAS